MALIYKILAGVSVCSVFFFSLFSSNMKSSLTFYGYKYLPFVTSKSPSTNPLQDLEVYVRYTTANPEFPKQAEAWIFRSISFFWPKNTKGKNFRTGPYFIMHAFLIINICGPLFFETMHIPKSTEYIHQ